MASWKAVSSLRRLRMRRRISREFRADLGQGGEERRFFLLGHGTRIKDDAIVGDARHYGRVGGAQARLQRGGAERGGSERDQPGGKGGAGAGAASDQRFPAD